MQFNLGHLSRLMQNISMTKHGFAYLVESNGYLVATSTVTPVVDTSTGGRVVASNVTSCQHQGIADTMIKLLDVSSSSATG